MSGAFSRVDCEFEFCLFSINYAYELFFNILSNFIDIYVPMCANFQRLPWSVNPPAALKLARANARYWYNELSVGYGRHIDFSTRY